VEFSTLLESNGTWDLPYSFQTPTGITMVHTGPPPPECDKLHVSLISSADSEAVVSNIENNNATDIQNMQLEKEEQPSGYMTGSEEGNTSLHMSNNDVEDSDSDQEDFKSAESVPPNTKWYIKKDRNNVHIQELLRYCCLGSTFQRKDPEGTG